MKTLAAILFLASLAAVAACGGSNPPVCSLDGGAPLAASDWPKFRGDIANTGQSSADLSSPPPTGEMRLDWSFETGGAVSSSPAIGTSGEIYIGSADSRIYRINRDGQEAWQQPTNNTITTAPALDTLGNVFVTSNDGNLYTLSNATGVATRSAVTVLGSLSSPNLAPAPNAGVVYFGSLSTGLFASCPNSILRWASNVVPVIATPAIDHLGNVLATSANIARTLLSTNPTTGQQNWTFTATATINASPVIGSDGTVYTVDARGRLFGVNPTTGASISNAALFDLAQESPGADAQVFASPALRTDVLDTIYIPDTTGTLWAVTVDTTADPPSAQVRWHSKVAEGGIFSSPVVSTDGTLVFGADDGNVYAVQDAGDTGTLRWTYATEGAVRSSPAILQDAEDTIIYVGSNDRRVYALRPPA